MRNKLKNNMEEAAVFKKEASDERLRRIESERMVNSYYHVDQFLLQKVILSRLESHILALSCVSTISQRILPFYKVRRLT